MAQTRTLEKLLSAGAGWARMNAAVVGDLASALNPVGGNGHAPDDWLDAWDPAYTRTTLPTLRLFSDVYHRADVRGLSNIPDEGPVLLVGNHSGVTLISDIPVDDRDRVALRERLHLAHQLGALGAKVPQIAFDDLFEDAHDARQVLWSPWLDW